MSDSIPHLLGRWADATPRAPALLGVDRDPLTHRALRAHVASVGAQLRELGLGRSDRVALVLPNGPEAASAFLAVASAATCAPLNPGYRAAELDFYLGDLRAQAVVVDAADGDAPVRRVARARGIALLELERTGAEAGRFRLVGPKRAAGGDDRPARPEDAALVLHTSGTTARPKLVPLSHANLCASAANVALALELSRLDRGLNVMPLFHIHGLIAGLLASLSAGASVVCAPGFHAPSFLGWLQELEPTWYTAVPAIHQGVLARAGGRPVRSRLRFVRSSSAPLPRPLAAELEAALAVPVIESYGMTEAAHQIASNPPPPGERRPGSVGPAAGPEVAILDEEGRVLPPTAIGEVAIRGANVFAGYEHNPQANEAAFADGWFRTGDEGFLEDGYLFLRGRLGEIINRGGEKIAPGEVEEALLAHAEVAQAVAFAVPSARLGEEVGAAVVLREGSKPGEHELRQFVAGRLADFKVPRVIAAVPELPQGATGKLQRAGLAERLGLGAAAATPTPAPSTAPPGTSLERRLAALWQEILAVGEVGVEDDFFAVGGDSILAAELVSRLREAGWPELTLTALVQASTVSSLAAELERGRDDSASALVPLQTGGDRPALFFVHALDGEVVRFGALARFLGPEQPFYALREMGLEQQEPRHPRVEEMAAHYLAEIRSAQPRGPYLLGGLCMGAPIAIEMARTLLAQGEQVPLLALVDPHVPVAPGRARVARRRALHTLLRRPRPDPYSFVPTPYLRRMARIRDAYAIAPYPGTVTFFLSDEHTDLRWVSAVKGGADVHRLGGTHMGLLRRPAVERLAELVAKAVDASA